MIQIDYVKHSPLPLSEEPYESWTVHIAHRNDSGGYPMPSSHKTRQLARTYAEGVRAAIELLTGLVATISYSDAAREQMKK